ncbi:MAG: cereblon family protein [Nannocystaceae bacterium]
MYVQQHGSRLALTRPPKRVAEKHGPAIAGEETDPPSRKRYVCRTCGIPVTSLAARKQVAGSHRHTFVNPQGESFELGCFAEAPGAMGVGPPTEHFTWFPGAPWRGAVCRGCGTQLGWAFGEPIDFYGLIFTRLTLASPE